MPYSTCAIFFGVSFVEEKRHDRRLIGTFAGELFSMIRPKNNIDSNCINSVDSTKQ